MEHAVNKGGKKRGGIQLNNHGGGQVGTPSWLTGCSYELANYVFKE
jgi:hypothetical protein